MGPNVDWRFWGPVLAGMGTLNEVRHEWTLYDLLDAHEVLAVKAEMSKPKGA